MSLKRHSYLRISLWLDLLKLIDLSVPASLGVVVLRAGGNADHAVSPLQLAEMWTECSGTRT